MLHDYGLWRKTFVARDALFMLPRVRCQIPLLVEQGRCKDFIKATSPLCPLAFFTANIAHAFLKRPLRIKCNLHSTGDSFQSCVKVGRHTYIYIYV